MKYTLKGGQIWLQGSLGYILMVLFLAMTNQNNKNAEEMLLRLGDHVFPFFVYGWGFALMGLLFDTLSWVIKKVQDSSRKGTEQ